MTNFLVTWVHRVAITSAAFWLSALSLGFVFGAVPAQAMLLKEVRTWRQVADPPLGIFNRMLRGTWQRLIPALAGSAMFGLAAMSLLGVNIFQLPIIIYALAVICAFWALLIAMHFAWLMSSKVSPRASKVPVYVEFLACAWVHLIGAIIWICGVLFLPIILFPLMFFLPTMAAFVIVTVEGPARAFAQHSD